VAVSGGYAYLADIAGGLRVISVSNPAHPVEVGSLDLPGWAAAVAVDGTYAYVASFDGGLRVVSVSNPAHPVEVGYYPTQFAEAVAVAGGYAYVSDLDLGLVVLDLSNPALPVLAGYHDTPGYPTGVSLGGEHTYVADGDAGLQILQFPEPVAVEVSVEGGSLSSEFDQTGYVFGAGTFSESVIFTHTPLLRGVAPAPGELGGVGHSFRAEAFYSGSGLPAEPAPGHTYAVSVHYADARAATVVEGSLGLYSWESNAWVREPSSAVDTANNLVTATPNHLGVWAVLGETNRIFVPLVLRSH
jgi:hypothetical protein